MAKPSNRLAGISLVLFVGVLCFVGLTSGDLIRNEGLRGQLAVEAWRTGNWLVPALHGEPHLTKPPGMTLLIGLCSLPVGRITPVTARLPSVVAGLVVVVLFYRTFSRALGPRAGLLAAAIVPCSGLWLDRIPSAEIDLVQLAWVTGSLLCLLRAVEIDFPPSPLWGEGLGVRGDSRGCSGGAPGCLTPTPHPQPLSPQGRGEQERCQVWRWWLASMACVTGGFFTKWTAPAFFYLTAVPFLAFQGRLSLLVRLPHLLGALLVAVLALGWLALAGHTAGWSVLIDTISREALLRLSPHHHPRPYPWGELATFPLSFLAANLPWSACAVFTLAPSFRRRWDERTRRLLLLCQAWLWPNLLFWTVVPGHRPRHLLPGQPALAALAALVWIAWLRGWLRWPISRLRPSRVLIVLFIAWLAVKMVFVGVIQPDRQVRRQPRREGRVLARLVPRNQPLYLFRLKDEGLLFYYGRPAHRLRSPEDGPPAAWCLLTWTEWQSCRRRVRMQASLHDGQGAPLVLVRLPGAAGE